MLINYFREVQSSYDQRSKAVMKVSNVIGNAETPSMFITDGGLGDATRILSDFHKHSLTEANKSRDIEQDVISALTGLRADLGSKIKEIKSLSGDFKNSVDREKEATRKAIAQLGDALQQYDHTEVVGAASSDARSDPFIVRLNVDRQVEKQIDEENYLHRAYLNLESSGRELESIVVGEIQKAFNALAGILRREGDDAFAVVEAFRSGPIGMPKDLEWNSFVSHDPHFVNPALPIRKLQDIDYPGKFHPAVVEIRAGMLERKSKYLKSYTPGWYVLSPTHLHEFKSADNIYSQPPVMSLNLAEQKLGSNSAEDSSSHKFMLKGRQSGGMHRGHSWVFRAESRETMMAWMEAIKNLTEKTGAERNAFVRQHARSVSGTSARGRALSSTSSDILEEDEADAVPYAASTASVIQPAQDTSKLQRPQPGEYVLHFSLRFQPFNHKTADSFPIGGRFPSDLNVPRSGDAATFSDISSEPDHDHDTIAAVAMMPNSESRAPVSPQQRQLPSDQHDVNPYELDRVPTHASQATPAVDGAGGQRSVNDYLDSQVPITSETDDQRYEQNPQTPQTAVPTQTFVLPVGGQAPLNQVQSNQETPYQATGQAEQPQMQGFPRQIQASDRHNSNYGDWFGPAAVGAAGVGAGVVGDEAYRRHQQSQREPPVLESAQEGNLPSSSEIDATVYAPGRPSTSTAAESYFTQSTAPTSVLDTDPGLGGLEAKGAYQTGSVFPAVIRHNTDMSVSALHVPGEFPIIREGVSAATAARYGIPTNNAWEQARE